MGRATGAPQRPGQALSRKLSTLSSTTQESLPSPVPACQLSKSTTFQSSSCSGTLRNSPQGRASFDPPSPLCLGVTYSPPGKRFCVAPFPFSLIPLSLLLSPIAAMLCAPQITLLLCLPTTFKPWFPRLLPQCRILLSLMKTKTVSETESLSEMCCLGLGAIPAPRYLLAPMSVLFKEPAKKKSHVSAEPPSNQGD